MKRFIVQIAVLPVLAGAFVGAQQPAVGLTALALHGSKEPLFHHAY